MNAVKNCKCIDVELETPEINAYMGRVIDRGYKKIPIDSELSETSENPVQNKVITIALQGFSEGQQTILQGIIENVMQEIGRNFQQYNEYFEVVFFQLDQKAPIDKPVFKNSIFLQSKNDGENQRQQAQIRASGTDEELYLEIRSRANNWNDINVRGVKEPVEPNDAVNKAYVDNLVLVDSEEEV